ncbi:DUF58 domain-containing protein [Halobacterium jilantaiense]|uniref:Conserved repeat domain-containing protein n=1 Tax=Halobacterium jilantaiense TaxID=355548 RepID=A0A1I0QI01_9EURY|nr:DUF58 domain-containing protein [Halobacterium jilantaiense]SEW26707.1 conserved repeat domain-containing protein [Halobacterium jilantaiense]
MTGGASASGAVRPTGRWRGLAGAALLPGVVGLFARTPALLSVSALGVALAAYARGVEPPPAASVSVSRTVSDSRPDPGDEVTVTVAVENTGSRTIPALEVADGVPPGLSVTTDSPVLGTALPPGSTATVTYHVAARRGAHEFEPATVVTRDVAGVVERRVDMAAQSSDTIDTRSVARESRVGSLPATPTPRAGTRPADASGGGVAFRGVREYRRGDPLARVDWRRLARTGELATVEYHADRRATVVLVVDARRTAAVAPGPGEPTARRRAAEGADELYASLSAAGYRVGVAVFGEGAEWVPPGSGPAHDARVNDCLQRIADDPDSTADPPDWRAWLRERVPAGVAVVALTPVCDDAALDALHVLGARTLVRVVAPDPTAGDTPGHWLAARERSRRLDDLTSRKVPVADWPPGIPLREALAEAGWRG